MALLITMGIKIVPSLFQCLSSTVILFCVLFYDWYYVLGLVCHSDYIIHCVCDNWTCLKWPLVPKILMIASLLVFRLGRIFRLERSALFMAEFWGRLGLGAVNFHLRPCLFTWAKIGSPFEVTILALYSKVSSYHLTSTEFLITT